MVQFINNSQSYILECGRKLGYSLKIIEHDLNSDNCEDRSNILGVSLRDIVKSLYFCSNGTFIGVILPGDFPRVEPKNLFPEILGMSKSKANKYSLKRVPSGMSYGTCTPFPEKELIPEEIEFLLVWNGSIERTVYSALGGEDDLSHRLSLQLPSYDSIYQILIKEFGNNVVKSFNL